MIVLCDIKSHTSLGLGITYVAALHARVPVLLYDRSTAQVQNGLSLMDKLLTKDVNKGKITAQQASEARERIQVVDQDKGVNALRDVDMVIEVRIHRPTPLETLNLFFHRLCPRTCR